MIDDDDNEIIKKSNNSNSNRFPDGILQVFFLQFWKVEQDNIPYPSVELEQDKGQHQHLIK